MCISPRAVVPVNWVQAMEAVLDTAHLGTLHSSSVMLALTESARVQQTTCLSNTAPKIKYVLTPYGFKEAALREQASIGAGGGGEAPWNLDPEFAQRADHLADGGILATDDLDVVHGHAFEWQDEFVHGIS